MTSFLSRTVQGKLKSAVFRLVLTLAVWAIIEIISFLGYAAINRSLFSYAQVRARLEATAGSQSSSAAKNNRSELRWGDFVEVIHPYFGFAADPEQNQSNWAVSDYGFILSGETNPIAKRAPGKVTVALFGGSFAAGLYPSLRAILSDAAPTPGKEFTVLNFGGGGYKQPQQLMILSYLLALGAEFDAVINIDGFNEVAIPPAEHVPHLLNPFYPRQWDKRTAELITPATLRQIGYVEAAKDQQRRWAQTFLGRRLYTSPTLSLVWEYRDRRLTRKIYELNRELASSAPPPHSYARHGPRYSPGSDRAFFQDLAEVWRRCSLQMSRLCEANGSRYYHFLQPNRYIDGSKPLSAEERKQAQTGDDPYEAGAVRGYPLLSAAGVELREAGVEFSDLTWIFAENEDTLYIDGCHTNTAGYDIVARAIYRAIGAGL